MVMVFWQPFGRLHKGERNGDFHIGALDGGIGIPGAGTAAETAKAAASEEALEDIADIIKSEALGPGAAITASAAAIAGVHTGKTELVVPAALFPHWKAPRMLHRPP